MEKVNYVQSNPIVYLLNIKNGEEYTLNIDDLIKYGLTAAVKENNNKNQINALNRIPSKNYNLLNSKLHNNINDCSPNLLTYDRNKQPSISNEESEESTTILKSNYQNKNKLTPLQLVLMNEKKSIRQNRENWLSEIKTAKERESIVENYHRKDNNNIVQCQISNNNFNDDNNLFKNDTTYLTKNITNNNEYDSIMLERFNRINLYKKQMNEYRQQIENDKNTYFYNAANERLNQLQLYRINYNKRIYELNADMRMRNNHNHLLIDGRFDNTRNSNREELKEQIISNRIKQTLRANVRRHNNELLEKRKNIDSITKPVVNNWNINTINIQEPTNDSHIMKIVISKRRGAKLNEFTNSTL